MNSENQQISDPSETHLIEDIDINGYLLGCDDDEVNHDNIIGRFFDTPDDVYTFYNQYAFVHGFGIRIHWKYKNKTTNEVYRKLFVCNKQGFKKQKGDNSSEVSKKRRRDVRTGCEAELRISKTKGGKWCVDIFNDTHNHDLTTTPTKVMKHRSHNKFHRSRCVRFATSSLPTRVESRDTVEDFESQWVVLRDKYNLETSNWMMEMYKQRKFWVSAFFKDIFLAGMTTSGRSESIHSFYDGFVNSKTMLNEFVIQFDKAVDTRRAAEEDEDFKTTNSRPILSSIHPIEAKAGECYTKKIFELFQKEWIEATTNLTHETKSKSEEKSSYWVGRVNVDKRYKGGNASIGIDETNSENGVSALALWYVQANLTKAIEQARDAPSEIKRLNSFLVEFLEDQMIRKKPTEIENAYKDARVGISQVDMMPQISVRDPVVLTILKGHPRNVTRVKPPIEVKQKKIVTCSYCKESGHNITGCKKKKAASMQEKK
ncbi:FAR1-related sequence 5-like protein [Tanacetum coccineum]